MANKKPKTNIEQDAGYDLAWKEYLARRGDPNDAKEFCTGAWGTKAFEDWAATEGSNDFEAFVATLRARYIPPADGANAPTDDKVAFTPDPSAIKEWEDYVAKGGLDPGSEMSFMDHAGAGLYKCAQDAGYEGSAADFENLLNTISLAKGKWGGQSQDESTDFNPISNIDPEAVNADLDAIIALESEIREINFDMKSHKKSLKKKGISGPKLKAALEFRKDEAGYRDKEQGVRQLIMVLDDFNQKTTDDAT